MKDDKKNIKYTLGANSDATGDHEHSSVSTSFEISSKDQTALTITPQKRTRRHFGTHLPIYYKHGEPVLTIGPHWPFFLCMWLVLLGVGALVIFYVAVNQSVTSVLLMVTMTIWESAIYLYTALKNPGIASAPDPDDPEIENIKDYPNFCKPCKILKTDDIYHCYDCDVCIKGYDHHCPWTGKCIGEGNLKPFYTFLMSTTLYIIFCILMTVNLL